MRTIDREKQLSFAHQLARIGSWEWDPTRDVVVASPELQVLFGASPDAVRMDDWLSAVDPEDLVRVRVALEELLTNGEPVELRFRLKTAAGTAHVHVRAERVGDRVIGVTQDVTQQTVAESALRESEARYRTLVEQAKDTIVSIDLNGRITALNRAAEELTGASRVEWIGRSIFEALAPQSVEIAEHRFANVIAGEEPQDYMEYGIRRRDGRTATVEAQVRAVRASGRIVGVVLVARDVTARKEAEARAEQDKRLASLGQLATSVAHEFNNVLMSIMPFAELMQRRLPDDPQVITATRHIIEAVRRGREISQEILRFARPANPSIAPLVVADWVEDFRRSAVAMLGPLYTVSVTLPQREVAALADRTLLDQVATNIAINAREAMPSGGSFQIGVRSSGEAVLIDFTDSGPGIPAELHDRIFEPLYTTKRGGNGLGLSIAHQAMVRQNGTIRVRSVVGEGSTFTVTLPLAPAATTSAEPGRSGMNRRVLIVEDDESVGEGLRILLTDEGFQVRLIERGLQTVRAIESFRPDLVLLDVNLPDVSGVDVYDEIRARNPRLPVIFSTGHADARALADVHDRRVPSIMKPYEVDDLLSLMSDVMR